MKLNLTNNRFIYLFIFLLSFGVYSNSIPNGYSFDDNLITDNFQQKKSVSDIFTSYSFVNKMKEISFAYRPVVLSSFVIENFFVKNNPQVSHSVNVFLYAIVCMLIFYFLYLLFPDINKFTLLLAVILFIIHPLHTEPVDNIKSRDELLVGLFGFLSLIQYLRYFKTKKIFHLLLLIVFALLGIFSKLSILVYLGLIPVVYLLISKKIKVSHLLLILFVFVFTYLSFKITKYFLLNHNDLMRHYEYFENPLYYLDFWHRIPAGFSVWLVYVLLLLNPFKLSFYYGFNVIPIDGWTDFFPYFGILLFAGLTYLFFKLWRKYPFASFGIAVLLLNGLAVSNIFTPLPGVVAERFFFVGVLGFSIIVAYLITSVLKKIEWINIRNTSLFKLKPAVFFLLILFLLPFAYKTYSRNFEWKSTETLFKADISHLKNSAKANEAMGSVYLSKFRMSRNNNLLIPAKKYYLQCVKVYPQYAAAWNNLGFINRYFGDLDEAEKDYLNAHKYNPQNVITIFNLATFYQAQNNTERAKQFYKKAIRVNPDAPELLPYLKVFIIKENLTDEFIPYLKELIDSTDNYNLQLLLIDLYNNKKDYNQMLLQLKETYKKHPTTQLKQYIKEVNRIFKK